jgi:pimeloyl-ACP methyl ester carboxylesterase
MGRDGHRASASDAHSTGNDRPRRPAPPEPRGPGGNDPRATERPYESLDEARAAVRLANPEWTDGDVEAKAVALTEFDADTVLAVLLQNGDWDAGLAALARPEAMRIPAWLIAGEWASGCFIPDPAIPIIERQLGADRVTVIRGAPHSPQRTHPAESVAAILRAIDSP